MDQPATETSDETPTTTADELFKAEVPPQYPAFYVVRTGGQTGTGIVFLNAARMVQSFGSAEKSDPDKLVSLPLMPYKFGPRIDMDDQGNIVSVPW